MLPRRSEYFWVPGVAEQQHRESDRPRRAATTPQVSEPSRLELVPRVDLGRARALHVFTGVHRLAGRWLTALSLFGGAACASRHDTGEALVATGAVVALVSSQAATGNHLCVQNGCSGQTSRHAAAAAAGVAAGVALAAAGAALQEEPSVDSTSPPPRPEPEPQSENWRLIRKPSPEAPEEGPAYYIEE